MTTRHLTDRVTPPAPSNPLSFTINPILAPFLPLPPWTSRNHPTHLPRPLSPRPSPSIPRYRHRFQHRPPLFHLLCSGQHLPTPLVPRPRRSRPHHFGPRLLIPFHLWNLPCSLPPPTPRRHLLESPPEPLVASMEPLHYQPCRRHHGFRAHSPLLPTHYARPHQIHCLVHFSSPFRPPLLSLWPIRFPTAPPCLRPPPHPRRSSLGPPTFPLPITQHHSTCPFSHYPFPLALTLRSYQPQTPSAPVGSQVAIPAHRSLPSPRGSPININFFCNLASIFLLPLCFRRFLLTGGDSAVTATSHRHFLCCPSVVCQVHPIIAQCQRSKGDVTLVAVQYAQAATCSSYA
jgi:hypothetical protein